ncbi:MAG: class I SAM-dependent methyltransferase [Nitrospirae bacterium]|nr:class I SAM-dependent methyltransferase [Candidatus Manganitrophaceae bacterium]
MDIRDWDQIAGRYNEEIISPFQEGVVNPLFEEILALPAKAGKRVADLGCGTGPLLPFLSQHFGQVAAVDFSPKMLEAARKRTQAKNISFHRSSLTDLSPFYNQFDIAVAVNSILFPSSKSIDTILSEIQKALLPEGVLMAIFPSMEVILYQGALIFDREIEKIGDEEKALSAAKRILERRKFDFISGIYDDHGLKQKFFYEFEIKHRLKKSGFKNIRIKKVLYPWGGQIGGFEHFHDQPRLWDWFITAKPHK